MEDKTFKLMFHIEVEIDGQQTVKNLDLITKLIKQTILQETNNTVEIGYVSCEILGIDGE